jgi:hypothetical protein
LLNNNNILHGGLQVENNKSVCNEDLEDTGTSSIVSAEAVATKECHVVGDNVLPTNLAFPFHK